MSRSVLIRTVKTASGASAVQLIRYQESKRIILKHVGSAHTAEELQALKSKALKERDNILKQRSLFSLDGKDTKLMHMDHMQLHAVTHNFAYDAFRRCCNLCGLDWLSTIYQDFAIMRIIEPTSKLRTIKLINRYFNVSYAQRTVYRKLSKFINNKEKIEKAAYKTATTHFGESFALVLYDVTTLYFESHEPDDELRARGFSKDDKSKQPQIVIGLLVTLQGFPLMHEVYKGNTFEGHTMLNVVKQFQKKHTKSKPIIVADAAMLSRKNLHSLETEGYQYIVAARLSNASPSFIDELVSMMKLEDGYTLRLPYSAQNYEIICTYSERRYKKDKRQFEKQITKAKELIARNEPGKRAKFVKKLSDGKNAVVFDEALQDKTEKLLGIKGYCTNIPENILSNDQIVSYYHDLWRVEQTFRMSKTDLKTRPIFHFTHDAIKAHVLLCFMALIMGKFLELKTGISLRRIRDILWNVYEAHVEDKLTGEKIKLQTNTNDYQNSGLYDLLKPH